VEHQTILCFSPLRLSKTSAASSTINSTPAAHIVSTKPGRRRHLTRRGIEALPAVPAISQPYLRKRVAAPAAYTGQRIRTTGQPFICVEVSTPRLRTALLLARSQPLSTLCSAFPSSRLVPLPGFVSHSTEWVARPFPQLLSSSRTQTHLKRKSTLYETSRTRLWGMIRGRSWL
jgi:hypothetical protein